MIAVLGAEPASALGCCLLLALATWLGGKTTARAPTGALAVAAGLLVAMVALDLAPDALADGAEQGTPAVVLVATAGGVGLALRWLLRSWSGAGSGRWRLRTAGAGMAAHRVLEGTTLGLAAATDLRAGVLVLVALVLHGGCEGAVLSVTGGDGRCSQRATDRWLAVLCVAPVPGVAFAGLAGAAGVRALVGAAVCGVLLTTGLGNLRRAEAGSSRARSAVLGAAGAGVLALTLHLAA